MPDGADGSMLAKESRTVVPAAPQRRRRAAKPGLVAVDGARRHSVLEYADFTETMGPCIADASALSSGLPPGAAFHTVMDEIADG